MVVVFGLFNENNFRSYCLLKDIKTVLPDAEAYIVWDKYKQRDPEFGIDEFTTVLDRDAIIQWCSTMFATDLGQLRALQERYPPALKIFMAIYLNKAHGFDYGIMLDNDIFLYEDVPEIRELANNKKPFLIPELWSGDILPSIVNLIGNSFRRHVFYRSPKKGAGYNVGFCGLDLRVFGDITSEQFRSLALVMATETTWSKEQAFMVLMQFSAPIGSAAIPADVHTFADQKYYFDAFNSPDYASKSKIMHCIGTKNKQSVNMLYSLRYPSMNAQRYVHIINHLRQHSCRSLLEIGLWRGDTSRMLILNSCNDEMEYVGVDLFEETNDELIEQERSLRADSMEKVRRRLSRYTDNFSLYRGFSRDVLPTLRRVGKKFDAIWIDGGHSYETVKFDFEQCVDMLAPGGVIFFDDYTEDTHLPDVKRYIDAELLGRDDLTIEIHSDVTDTYRGHAYKVVSVRIAAPG